MIKIAGVWELGWNAPLSEYDLWLFLRDFAVDEWYMSPVSGISKRDVTEVPCITDAIEANPDLTPVYVDEKGETPLRSFQHPENPLYVFGKVGKSPWSANGKKGISVRIETPGEHGLIWPHQCLAIVLYDRISKQ